VRKDTPAKGELGGGELCTFYLFNCLFALCTACLSWCCGIYVVNPMQAVIITVFGKILRVEMVPGVHWMPPLMVEKHFVNLAINTMQVKGSSVPDSNGSPMTVSTIVNYIINDPVAAVYSVENLYTFIHTQAYDVVRRICGKFRYISNDPAEITLLNDGHHICGHMKQLLQKRCEIAGVTILRMDFIDIAYHTEIAAQLLQVQQA
jgi:regulator of protease activity HflC (stomatin/prohibitin superfamily)